MSTPSARPTNAPHSDLYSSRHHSDGVFCANDAPFPLAASTMINSYLINRRLLEDTTHPLWTWFLNRLCGGKYDVLWPAPQWRIYVSRQETGSDKASVKTAGDSTARGAITDFCILLPIFKQVGILNHTTIRKLHPNWTAEEWYKYLHKTELAQLRVPLLMELKRPITRSAADIYKYAICIATRIRNAQTQLKDQVLCLYCSRKYSGQSDCILVAAAGEWFSFCTASRQDILDVIGNRQFELSRYGMILDLEQAEEKKLLAGLPPTDDAGDAEFLTNPDGYFDPEEEQAFEAKKQEAVRKARMVSKDIRQALDEEKKKLLEQRIAENKNRDDRAKRRARAKGEPESESEDDLDDSPEIDGNPDNLKLFYEFVGGIPQDPTEEYYADEDLITLAKLHNTVKDVLRDRPFNFKFLPDDNVDYDISNFSRFRWSPITRLRSKVADEWCKHMQDILYDLIENVQAGIST